MDPQFKAQMDNDLRHVPFGTMDHDRIISSLAYEAVAQEKKTNQPHAVAAVLLSNYKPFIPYAKFIGGYKGQQALYLVGPLQMLSQVRKSGGTGFVMTKDGQLLPTSDASNEMHKLSERINQTMTMAAANQSTQAPRKGDGSKMPTGPAHVMAARKPIPKPPAVPAVPRSEDISQIANFITEDIRESNGINNTRADASVSEPGAIAMDGRNQSRQIISVEASYDESSYDESSYDEANQYVAHAFASPEDPIYAACPVQYGSTEDEAVGKVKEWLVNNGADISRLEVNIH